MTANSQKHFASAIRILEDVGLLREYDVCRIVTQREIRGSWWGDPASHEIFALNEQLFDHPDVTVTKLISGKITFVHRKLWQKLVAVGSAREDWQIEKLSPSAKLLLRQLDKNGSLLTNQLGPRFGPKPGDTARELELKLLIHSEQQHSESGAHTKLLETWEHWSNRVGVKSKPIESSRARNFFEKRLLEINDQFVCMLPWQKKK
jgi:hypothetical protein